MKKQSLKRSVDLMRALPTEAVFFQKLLLVYQIRTEDMASPRRLSFSSCFAPEAANVSEKRQSEDTEIFAEAPPPKKKRGRKKLWEARVLNEEDVANTRTFMKTYGCDISAKERVLSEYRTFCAKNGLSLTCGLEACVGQMITSGLMASTRDTYSAFIAAKYSSVLHRMVRRACMSAHADADVEGAPRFSRQELKVRAGRLKNPLIRNFVHRLIILGYRPVAGRRSMNKNTSLVKLSKLKLGYALVCQVPWDKTVQKRAQRQHLRLPNFMVEGLYTRKELEDIFHYVGSGSAKPFKDVDTQDINKAFRETTMEGETAPTSYSARRAYIQEVFEQTGGDREKMKEMTLHFTDQVMRAHYVDWFANTERRAQDVPEDLGDDTDVAEQNESE